MDIWIENKTLHPCWRGFLTSPSHAYSVQLIPKSTIVTVFCLTTVALNRVFPQLEESLGKSLSMKRWEILNSPTNINWGTPPFWHGKDRCYLTSHPQLTWTVNRFHSPTTVAKPFSLSQITQITQILIDFSWGITQPRRMPYAHSTLIPYDTFRFLLSNSRYSKAEK